MCTCERKEQVVLARWLAFAALGLHVRGGRRVLCFTCTLMASLETHYHASSSSIDRYVRLCCPGIQ